MDEIRKKLDPATVERLENLMVFVPTGLYLKAPPLITNPKLAKILKQTADQAELFATHFGTLIHPTQTDDALYDGKVTIRCPLTGQDQDARLYAVDDYLYEAKGAGIRRIPLRWSCYLASYVRKYNLSVELALAQAFDRLALYLNRAYWPFVRHYKYVFGLDERWTERAPRRDNLLLEGFYYTKPGTGECSQASDRFADGDDTMKELLLWSLETVERFRETTAPDRVCRGNKVVFVLDGQRHSIKKPRRYLLGDMVWSEELTVAVRQHNVRPHPRFFYKLLYYALSIDSCTRQPEAATDPETRRLFAQLVHI